MPHKLRKIRKLRGSRTCGYGRVGQHRKSGSKGYRKAGRHKHGWSYTIKYMPDYFRKKGFLSPKSLYRNIRVINVGELENLFYRLYPQKKKITNVTIDLDTLGFNKLLGKGRISHPITVKVRKCSQLATRKIEEAGGKVLIIK
ncbi:TPA: 50S ribosomal protein L15 [Candidatus Bathyarchaeota archaeon]|nr:50S ribosomal protein L15 [Candidatus Bathyarchaeota archaeon]